MVKARLYVAAQRNGGGSDSEDGKRLGRRRACCRSDEGDKGHGVQLFTRFGKSYRRGHDDKPRALRQAGGFRGLKGVVMGWGFRSVRMAMKKDLDSFGVMGFEQAVMIHGYVGREYETCSPGKENRRQKKDSHD